MRSASLMTKALSAQHWASASRFDAVLLEERDHDALEAEADARGMRAGAVCRVDVEDVAEVLLVVVERSDRGRLVLGPHRHEQLELELLRPAAFAFIMRPPRPKNGSLAAARPTLSPQRLQQVVPALHPCAAPLLHVLGRAEPDVLADLERLHARRIGRRLVPEAELAQVEQLAARRARCRPASGRAGSRRPARARPRSAQERRPVVARLDHLAKLRRARRRCP